MIYKVATWELLAEEVEHQGGMILPEKCLPEDVEFKPPQKNIPGSHTCGCNNFTRVVSPYAQEDEDHGGFVTACAVCDNVGAWPRYEEVVKELDPTYWDDIAESEEDE